jgi:hypothetical protein
MAKKTLDILIRMRDKFSPGLAKFEKSMTRLQGRVAKSIARMQARFARFRRAVFSLKSAIVGLIALWGVRRFWGSLTETLQRVDELGKFAQRVGMSTESLSQLQFAAEETGVKVQALNMGLQRMTRRVSEAAQGMGEAQGAIRELGLDADRLARLAPDQQFRELARAMQDVESNGDRVRLTMKLFDSEGVSLVNTLALGTHGLDQMARKADLLGITINELAAKRAAAFNDAINRMKRAMGGLYREVVVHMSPGFTALADAITTIIAAGREKWEEWAKDFGENVTLVLEGIGAALIEFVAMVEASYYRVEALVLDNILKWKAFELELYKLKKSAQAFWAELGGGDGDWRKVQKAGQRQLAQLQKGLNEIAEKNVSVLNSLGESEKVRQGADGEAAG